MKQIVFNVPCFGFYETSLLVDDDLCTTTDLKEMSDDEFYSILDYINYNLPNVNVTDIEWIDDGIVEAEDIKYIDFGDEF